MQVFTLFYKNRMICKASTSKWLENIKQILSGDLYAEDGFKILLDSSGFDNLVIPKQEE